MADDIDRADRASDAELKTAARNLADSSIGDSTFGSVLNEMAATDAAGAAGTSGKVCCVCGTNLKGKTRLKDKEGRYWCMDCGQADSQKKRPARCPDCSETFPQGELVEDKGVRVCTACYTKRRMAAKREEARIARAQEEARLEAARRQKIMIISIVVVSILALYGLYRLLHG